MGEELKYIVQKAHIIGGKAPDGAKTEWVPYPRVGTVSLDEVFSISEHDKAEGERFSLDGRLESFGIDPLTILNKKYIYHGAKLDDVTIKRLVLSRLEGYTWDAIWEKLHVGLGEQVPKRDALDVIFAQRVSQQVRTIVGEANRIGIRASAILGDPDIRDILSDIRDDTDLEWWQIFGQIPSYRGEKATARDPTVNLHDFLEAYFYALRGLKFKELVPHLQNRTLTPKQMSSAFRAYLSPQAKSHLPQRAGKARKIEVWWKD